MLDRSLVLLSLLEVAQQQQHEIKCGGGGLFVLKITPGKPTPGETIRKNNIELHGSDGRIYGEIGDASFSCKGHAISIEYGACQNLQWTDGAHERVQGLLDFDFDKFTASCEENPAIGPECVLVSLDLIDKLKESHKTQLRIYFKTFRGDYTPYFKSYQFIKLSERTKSPHAFQKFRGSNLLTASYVCLFYTRKTEPKKGGSIIVARAKGDGPDIEFDCDGTPAEIKKFYECIYPNIYIESVLKNVYKHKIIKEENDANGKPLRKCTLSLTLV